MKNIVNILFIFAVETAKIGCARHNAQAALGDSALGWHYLCIRNAKIGCARHNAQAVLGDSALGWHYLCR